MTPEERIDAIDKVLQCTLLTDWERQVFERWKQAEEKGEGEKWMGMGRCSPTIALAVVSGLSKATAQGLR